MKSRREEKTKRRSFLKASTAAAVGLVGLKPETVFGAPLNSAPTIGIIGCGDRARYVGRFFDAITEARVMALADPFADRLEQTRNLFEEHSLFKYIQTFKGLYAYRDLLNLGVYGVVITSPPYFHPEQARDAVEAGKHVYMAKPVAVDTPGCLSIMESSRRAAEKNLNFLVDFQTRASPYFIEAARRVRAGAIGKPVCGQVFYHTGWRGIQPTQGMSADEARLRNWVFDIALSGDIIVEQHIHAIDVADWYLGVHPLKAYGTGGREARTSIGDCWDHFIVIYWYPNDVRVDFSSSQFLKGFHDICIRMYGTEGTLDSHYNGHVRITGDNPWEGIEEDRTYRNGTIANIRMFVANIMSGKVTNNGAISAESTLTAILGRSAAYAGREVTWDEMIRNNEGFTVSLNL